MAFAIALASCGQTQNPSTSAKNTASTNDIANMEIAAMQALYSNTRLPADFYRDDVPAEGFYTISHVKNTDLLAPTARSGIAVYELSTDDFTEALDWTETAASYQTGDRQLVDNSDTELFMQFSRADPAAPDLIQLSRVFKLSVLDRNGVDRNNDEAYQGRVTSAELGAQQLKSMLEYLWLFSFSNNYGNAVLSSVISETNTEFLHTMLEAKLTLAGTGDCDQVDIYETIYATDKASGMIWKSRQLMQSFFSRNDAGVYSVCESVQDYGE